MKPLGVLLTFLGIAIFVMPLLKMDLAIFSLLGNFRSFAAIIFILSGIGIFLFSND